MERCFKLAKIQINKFELGQDRVKHGQNKQMPLSFPSCVGRYSLSDLLWFQQFTGFLCGHKLNLST